MKTFIMVLSGLIVVLLSGHLYAQEGIAGKEHYQSGSPGYMAGKEHYLQDSSASDKAQLPPKSAPKEEQLSEPANNDESPQESGRPLLIIVSPPVAQGNSEQENP